MADLEAPDEGGSPGSTNGSGNHGFDLPSGWGVLAPGFLQDASNLRKLAAFLATPGAFILGYVINALIINPFKWFVAFVDWAAATSIAAIETSLRRSFGAAGDAIWMGVIGKPHDPGAVLRLNQTIEGSLVGMGLGAPIATTIVLGLWFLALGTVVYFLVRILIDAIPGGGAFL